MANRLSKADNIFRTTLTSPVSASSLAFPLATVTGLELPQYLVIDPEVPAKTEIIYFDGTISTLTVSTTLLANRNQEGSVSAVAHDSGAEVWATPVGQHVEDLHDRISLHNHAGTSLSGVQLDHSGLSGLTTDSHPFYIPANGTRGMSGDLDMNSNDITEVGAITGAGLTLNGWPPAMSVSNIDFERLNFTMPTGTGMRLARDLLGVPAFPGWERGHILIQVHLHLSAFNNSWRLDTLLDGTGVATGAGVGGVFLWASDDFFDAGGGGGSGHGQIFSNAGSGVDVQGLATYYQYRLE